LAKKVTKKGPQRNQLKRFLVAQPNAAHAGIFQVRSSVGSQPHPTVPVCLFCIYSNIPNPLHTKNTHKWVSFEKENWAVKFLRFGFGSNRIQGHFSYYAPDSETSSPKITCFILSLNSHN
jgi:hypothetical protein